MIEKKLSILNIDNHFFVNVGVSNDAAKLFKVDFPIFILKQEQTKLV